MVTNQESSQESRPLRIEGIPDFIEVLRWGRPDLSAGEFVFERQPQGHFCLCGSEGLVMKAKPGYKLNYNGWVSGWEVSREDKLNRPRETNEGWF